MERKKRITQQNSGNRPEAGGETFCTLVGRVRSFIVKLWYWNYHYCSDPIITFCQVGLLVSHMSTQEIIKLTYKLALRLDTPFCLHCGGRGFYPYTFKFYAWDLPFVPNWLCRKCKRKRILPKDQDISIGPLLSFRRSLLIVSIFQLYILWCSFFILIK